MRAPLSQQAQQALRRYIIENKLGPGDALPPEAELAELLEMGKTSVREGIRGLESLGVVEVRHGRGLFVGAFSFTPILDHLPYGLLLDNVPLRDLLQVRQALEEGLIEQASRALTPDDFSELDSLVEKMRASSVGGIVPVEVDKAFHLAVYRGLDNTFVSQLISVFWTVFDRASVNFTSTEVHHTADEHAAIVDAMRDGTPDEMRRAVSEHFADIRRNVGALSSNPLT